MYKGKVLYLLISCLVLQLAVQAQYSENYNDTGVSNYAAKILSKMTLEEKVAMILLPSQIEYYRTAPPEKPFSRNLLLSSHWLINGIDGFKTSFIEEPFPGIKAIAHLDDPTAISILHDDLLLHASREGYKAILASNNYLFANSGLNFIDAPQDKRDYTLWVFNDQNVDNIPVFEMPEDLFSKSSPFHEIRLNTGTGQFVQSWIAHQDRKKPGSFEGLLKSGGVFLTDDFEKDHAKILRSFQNNLINVEVLNRVCESVLTKTFEAGVSLPAVNNVPEGLRIFARRRAFEGCLHFFSGQDGPFLPSNLGTLNIKVISEVGFMETEAFSRMVNYHFPNYKTLRQPADYILWLENGKELNDSIITVKLTQLKQSYPKARIALFLADAGNYFEHNPLPFGIDALFTGSSNWPLVWEYLAQAAFSGMALTKSTTQEEWLTGVRHLSREVPKTRLKLGIPEEVALHRDSLKKIDELVAEAIRTKATPGAQVLIARDGIVAWNKSYGYHTYEKKQPVNIDDIYDVASVTKILATVPSLMKLYEEDKWALNDSLAQFFEETDTTEKGGITIKDLLLHESGLPSFIPFYLNTIDKDKTNGSVFGRRYSRKYNIKLDNYIYLNRTVTYRRDVFQHKQDENFSIPVANEIFMNAGYLDSIMQQVIEAPMRTRHKYLYSDLGFYFLGQLIPKLSGHSMNDFSRSYFYNPMGMYNTSFLPAMVFPNEKIVPTEDDKAFRKQLLDGWVHDPGAAMMGGVAGHAGLFANSFDLAKFMQMYLNGGNYGGRKYLDPSVLDYFTQTHSNDNRRGLGFDKPQPDTTKVSPASFFASPSSFGHSGFTGALVWADPEKRLVYIFLSNRIHPRQYNKKLIEDNYRTRIQDIVYRSVITGNEDE